MNLLEFCEKFKISQKRAKAMHKQGVLLLDDAFPPMLVSVSATLRTGKPLSALQLCYLAENTSEALKLGKSAGKALEQLDDIRDALGDRASIEIASLACDAAKQGENEALRALVAWIKSVLPCHDVGHAWIASRLLLALPEGTRQFDAPRITRALARCRALPDFAPFWRYEVLNKRNVTIYKKPLAPFDL